MARVSPKQHSFARGEITPRLHGREDTELYYTALAVARNYVVDGRGILERRPGTRVLGRTKNDGRAELLPFVYDENQSYILELGDEYLRAWFNFGLVLDGNTPSETATPYTDDEVGDISFTQSRDTMWTTHANHPPSIIQRQTENTFSFETFQTRDGPYLDANANRDAYLSITSGSTSNIGRGTFSDGDSGTVNDIPSGLVIGSTLSVWDGSTLQLITVQSIDAANNQIETSWTGEPIASTEQWSFDGNPAPSGTALAIEGTSGASSGTLTATGHAPFDAARDVGRWVRLLQEKSTDSSASLEERFEWHSAKITGVTSSTVATIEWSGGNVPQTTDWRLGAFYPGNYPSICTFHENRLTFALRNKIYFSAPGDYDNFSPSDVDSSVNPDNAITVSIPAVNAKKGSISDVTFMQSLGFQLVVGTPSGLHTIQSTSFGEALKPDTVTRRPQDSRGAALGEPIMIGESVIYLHSSRQKLMGTYYRDSYDRIGAQDLSLPADHLTQSKIKGVTWQEEPHSVAWCHMDDGTVNALTIQPEEKVQAWHSHVFGGPCISGSAKLNAKVESMATIPSSQSGDDLLHMVTKRTINNQDARFVEVLSAYWDLGQDVRESWFLDAALRYEGNTDAAKTITFTGTGAGPRSAVTNFTSPVIVDNTTLVFHDGLRWHHGRVSNVTANNDFTWTPTQPNTGPGPADGRWHRVDGAWVQLADDAEIDVYAQTYVEPANQTDVARWSTGVTSLSGLDDFEGEAIDLLVDGFPVRNRLVTNGEVTGLPNGHIILAGFPYESRAKLLSLEAGSQNGSAKGKQRPVYEVVIDVLESLGLESGTALPSAYEHQWEQFDPLKFGDNHEIMEGEPHALFTGLIRVSRDEQGNVDDPSIAWRQREPLPSTIRGVIARISQSDGR